MADVVSAEEIVIFVTTFFFGPYSLKIVFNSSTELKSSPKKPVPNSPSLKSAALMFIVYYCSDLPYTIARFLIVHRHRAIIRLSSANSFSLCFVQPHQCEF